MAAWRAFSRNSALGVSIKQKLETTFGTSSVRTQFCAFTRNVSFRNSQQNPFFRGKTCCQIDNLAASTRRFSARQTDEPSAKLSSSIAVGSKYGHRNENGKEGYGYMFMPPCLLAFSLFTKKKDEVQEAMEKLKNVDELEMLLRRAKLAESKREWAEADELYHQALSLLNVRKQEKMWEEKRVVQAQVHIYDNMANLALSRGRLKEAELLYKETVKGLLNSGRDKDDNAIIEVSLKLAMIYAMQQRDKEAEAGYHFCMNAQDNKIAAMDTVDEDTLALYGMCINSYSRFLIIHDRLQEAEEALEKTIGIATRALSKDHDQIAVLYSDLATVASMRQKHDAAEQYIDSAIDMGQRTNSPDLATFLCNKGLICLENNKIAVAEKCCNRALKLAREQKDKDTESEAELCLKEIQEKKKKS